MKPIAFILFALMFTGISSCKLCKKDKEETTATVAETDKIQSLIVDKEFTEPASADITIKQITIDGDLLSIDVSYSGGCEEHKFNLYFDGNYKKSLPPKAAFFLQHVPHTDQCRSIVDLTLKFDIGKSQYAGQKEIMVSVIGLENEVSYRY